MSLILSSYRDEDGNPTGKLKKARAGAEQQSVAAGKGSVELAEEHDARKKHQVQVLEVEQDLRDLYAE